jgi:predicted benzoate:H+ symporter BenE
MSVITLMICAISGDMAEATIHYIITCLVYSFGAMSSRNTLTLCIPLTCVREQFIDCISNSHQEVTALF